VIASTQTYRNVQPARTISHAILRSILLQRRWHPGCSTLAISAACALAGASLSYAARPLITDDARIVEPKACQLETWTRRNQGSTEYWALPACNPTGNVELTIGGARTNELGETHTTDEQLQAKTLFRPLKTNEWGIGLAVGYLTHPQLQPQRSVAADLYGYVPASFSFADDKYVVHTNLGSVRAESESHHRLAWGVGAEIVVNARLFFIPEIFSQTERGAQFQLGARYWLIPGRLQVDATVGDRIGRSEGERWLSVGFRFLSRPFLP
jgi:hypothetical protein